MFLASSLANLFPCGNSNDADVPMSLMQKYYLTIIQIYLHNSCISKIKYHRWQWGFLFDSTCVSAKMQVLNVVF